MNRIHVVLALSLLVIGSPPLSESDRLEATPDFDAAIWEEVIFIPESGIVPDSETAIAVAIAVWKPVYGESSANYESYSAFLENGIWHVQGVLPSGLFGGVPYARIEKASGKVLGIIHTQ